MGDASGTVARAVPTGRWLEDDESENCMQCQQEFSFFNRKHHCRKCGGLFCSTCASNWLALPPHMIITPPSALADASYELTGLARCCGNCANITPFGTGTGTGVVAAAVATTNGDSAALTHPNVYRPPQPYQQRRPVNGSNSGELVTNAHVTIPTPTASLPDIPNYREVNAEEYCPGGRFRRYLVNVPHDIRRGGRFSVSLDDRIMAVRLPPFIDPGERIYVKAPLCTELQAAEINVDVATCALDAASSTMEGGSSEDGNACDNCTYVNPHLFPSCQMCGGTLLARRNPHTGANFKTASALELLSTDVVKRYYVNIPRHITEGEFFQVNLDGRVYSVVSPAGAVGGEKVVVSGPDPKYTPLRPAHRNTNSNHGATASSSSSGGGRRDLAAMIAGGSVLGGAQAPMGTLLQTAAPTLRSSSSSSSDKLHDEIINVDLDDVSPEVLEAVKMVILTTASEEIETALLRLVDGGSLPSLPQALDIWRRMTDQGGSRTEEEEGGGFAACRRCTYHNRKADPECAMCGCSLVRQKAAQHAPSAVHELEVGSLPTATLVEAAPIENSSTPVTSSVEVTYDSSMIIAIAEVGPQCSTCGAESHPSARICSACGTSYSNNANFTTATVIQAYRR